MVLGKGKERLEMFSDGVIAIAITLLVLEIKVPPLHSIHSVQGLWHALGERWTSYMAFTISFAIVLNGWVGHHYMFQLVKDSSVELVFANSFLLFTIVLLPFPTALVAEYINTPYAQPAVVFYCFSALLNCLGLNIWYKAALASKSVARDEKCRELLRMGLGDLKQGLIAYTAILILAWFFPVTTFYINTALWVFWIILGYFYFKKRRRELDEYYSKEPGNIAA